ncbi:MAG: 1-acyl-sn-glycerol-3-phosphate acyltransferase [Dehalococcoidia bacterium]|nr:1-acyl-sn-glycerol-3-phosphate acyltransferase [Dehalococcoidia bacterium]
MSAGYFGVTVRGIEHLPPGPFILAAAHHSYLDGPVILAHLRRAVAPLLARGILRFPLTLFSDPWRPLPIDRVRPGGDIAALRAALEALRDHPVLVFPEGTRRRGEVANGLPGVGWLALRAGVPVLPAALVGARDALPRGAWWPRRRSLEVRIGPPLDLAGAVRGGRSAERAAEATALIMAALAALEAGHASPSPPPVPPPDAPPDAPPG